jgi:hypothetical protein
MTGGATRGCAGSCTPGAWLSRATSFWLRPWETRSLPSHWPLSGNGLLSCADPRRALCDGLSAAKIDALVRKWLRRLPHPFPAADRRAGYRYDVSTLQAEFSLTQVLDRPATERVFSLRKGGGVVDAPGRGLVGAKGEYPFA